MTNEMILIYHSPLSGDIQMNFFKFVHSSHIGYNNKEHGLFGGKNNWTRGEIDNRT